MALRVGLLDIGAFGVVLVAILLPPPRRPVEPAYLGEDPALTRTIALLQADVARDPADCARAEELASALSDAGQTDWAIRAGATAAARCAPATRWRALLAVSAVHTDRFEMRPALEWAEKTLAVCAEAGAASCPPHQRVRLEVYRDALAAGVASGIDPRTDPKGFDDAIRRQIPTVRWRPPRERKHPK